MSKALRRVLVIDRSAVVLVMMSEVLRVAGGFLVETAADAACALEKARQTRPDVLIVDLELPEKRGLEILRELRSDRIPAIVLSSHTRRAAAVALEAFDLGAVEVVIKPPHGLEELLRHSAPVLVELLRTVRLPADDCSGAAPALPANGSGARAGPFATRPEPGPPGRLIVVGASTGGPQALSRLLRHAPPDLPGMLVVQHMPSVFTDLLARRLDAVGPLTVSEARDGEPVLPGTVLIAPGDRHVQVAGEPRLPVARLWSGPPVHGHCPSVGVLFESALRRVGEGVTAVLLSGLGSDGVRAMGRLRDAGALTLAQTDETCVADAVPNAAHEAGAVEELLSPEDLARRLAGGGPSAGSEDVPTRAVPFYGTNPSRSITPSRSVTSPLGGPLTPSSR